MNVDCEERRTGLRPPRFGLAALMVAIFGLGLMFAIVHYVGMLGSAIAIFFILCVVAHIAGNAIGTKLRDAGSRPPDVVTGEPPLRGFAVTPAQFAPVSRLRERHSLGKRNIFLTAAGVLFGGLLGAAAFYWLGGGQSPLKVVAMGAGATAVLGGIWTFAAASFIQVLFGAWRHATRETKQR